MSKRLNILLFTLLFFVVGEAVVRFDQSTRFFQGEHTVDPHARPGKSPILELLDTGTYVTKPNQLRVMIIGDSYLHGLGMDATEKFSSRLHSDLLLQTPAGIDDVSVLDLTVAGYNTYMNTQKFFEYVDRFDPQVVVWGYMINDVYGRLSPEPSAPVPPRVAPQPTDKSGFGARVSDAVQRMLRVAQEAVYTHIKVLQFALPTLNQELKLRGIVLPGSQFYHSITRSHEDSFPAWQATSAMLEDVVTACRERGIHLEVLIDPTLNMLTHYSVFDVTDSRIQAFFQSQGVSALRGADWFPPGDAMDYAISRYDGHPNARAHDILAKNTALYLLAGIKNRFEEATNER